MPQVQIALSNVINVSILPTPQNLGVPNINTCALFTRAAAPVGYGSEQYGVYLDAAAVATDYGSNSDCAAIAAQFFAQNPNPIGTGGYLVIVPRTGGGTELVSAAITRTKDLVYYFGVLVDEEYTGTPAVLTALATFVQGLDKVLFYASSVIAEIAPGGLLDLIRSAADQNTRCAYYGTPLPNGASVQQTQMFAGAYAGRALSTDFSGSGTANTLHLKQLAGITPDQTINQSYLMQAEAAGADVYVSVAGIPGLFTTGTNGFWDQIYGQFALKFALQTAGFNYLAGAQTKIPQTESGMNGLKNAYRAVCAQFLSNGFAAPGAWSSSTSFGPGTDLTRNITDIGYYVYSNPIATQSTSDRVARKAPLVQIAIKLAGALHSSNVVVNINQ